MKNKSLIVLFLLPSILSSCVDKKTDSDVIDTGVSGGSSSATDVPLLMSTFASRKDNSTFPVTGSEFTAFFLASDRVVASLKDEQEGNATFTGNHSVIPSPLDDSDGRWGFNLSQADLDTLERKNNVPEKAHYLETIAKNGAIVSRGTIVACGASGTIAARIADCSTPNGLWSFYDGKKYGQDGEGDWKLVSVLDNAGTKYEVWRDERTKLLWSDKASVDYNWYQAAGYSKASADSVGETTLTSGPGAIEASSNQTLQPDSPISVCPDVITGAIAAGGGTDSYIYVNPETDFKAGLSYPQVTWRLPSRNDWLLAEVNGIRKVLPNMDSRFWSSSSFSGNRGYAWVFFGNDGRVASDTRSSSNFVRCVAPSRD